MIHKDKCDNCGSTKSETFWDFDDKRVLCDKCYRDDKSKHNEQFVLNKVVDKKKSIRKILSEFFLGLVLLFIVIFFLIATIGIMWLAIKFIWFNGFRLLFTNLFEFYIDERLNWLLNMWLIIAIFVISFLISLSMALDDEPSKPNKRTQSKRKTK